MNRFTPLWVFLVIFILGLVYLPGFAKYLKLKHKDQALYQELEMLKQEIAKLEEEEHLLKTDLGKLEEAVRQELGLVKPGETVVHIIEEEVPAEYPAPNPT